MSTRTARATSSLRGGGENSVSLLLGNGDGSFGPRTDFAAGGSPRSVAIADFNGDSRFDLAVANSNSHTVSVLLGDGSGMFQAPSSYSTGKDPIAVAIEDMNRDGRLDLVVANWDFLGRWSFEEQTTLSSVSVLMGHGDGTFGPRSDFTIGGHPVGVAIADFDADGNPDVATPNSSGRRVSVLIGRGDGSFAPKRFFPAGVVYSIGIGDFNSDGVLDVAVASLSPSTVSVLLGYGNGTFAPEFDYPTVAYPVGLVTGDFDADGKPDLAVTSDDSDSVSVHLNAALALPPTALPPSLQMLALRPNPAKETAEIRWVLPRESTAEATVFDVAGRRVRSLLSGVRLPAGEHGLRWDRRDDRGRRMSFGIYLVRLRAGGEERVARLILLP